MRQIDLENLQVSLILKVYFAVMKGHLRSEFVEHNGPYARVA